jgi:pimeloyl-ACP methyl ester carboxylesterase
MDMYFGETAAGSQVGAAQSHEWVRPVIALLDAAVCPLDHEQAVHGTIVHAASLLRKQITSQVVEGNSDDTGRLLTWQARKVRAYIDRMMGAANAHYLGIKAFSETDQTEDLKAIDVPTLVIQGDDDQIVPFKDAVLLQAKLIKRSTLKVYPGYPHGMLTVNADVINPDLLAFIKG